MSSTQSELFLGMRALAKGFLNASTLQQAIVEHARRAEMCGPAAPSFALLLVSGGYLSAEQLASLLASEPAPAAKAVPKPALPPAPPVVFGKFGKYNILRELGRRRGGDQEAVRAPSCRDGHSEG